MLVLLSVVLTASVLFPGITGVQIVAILTGGSLLGALVGVFLAVQARCHPPLDVPSGGRVSQYHQAPSRVDRDTWRMPPLHTLTRPMLSTQRKVGLITLRGYLIVAVGLVIVKIVQSITG